MRVQQVPNSPYFIHYDDNGYCCISKSRKSQESIPESEMQEFLDAVANCSAIAVQAGISNKELSHRRITRRQQKRNDEIFEKYQNGIDAKDLAKAYHYSLPGIYSIIRRVRKQKCKRD